MLTITLPEVGFERHYEPRLRELLVGRKVCGHLRGFRESGQWSPRQSRALAFKNARRIGQSWTGNNAEVIITSKGRDAKGTHAVSQYWLSPRPVESADCLLLVAIGEDGDRAWFSAHCVGDGWSPGAVCIIGAVASAPPVIMPVGFDLILELGPDAVAPEMSTCPDCECYHPRPAECPGPAVK